MAKLEGNEAKHYWDTLLDRRMPEDDEVHRLVHVLMSHYFSSCLHNGTISQDHANGLVEFHDSKRPYGSKNLPASIAFNLGWDYKRQLHYQDDLPPDAEAVALDLHAKVLEVLKESMFLYIPENEISETGHAN
jgi:hypothetical protein